MIETSPNNLEPILKKVTQKWSLDSQDARVILDIYEKNKLGTIHYTKESITWLRKVLGLDAREWLFGATEIQALRKVISAQVWNIIAPDTTQRQWESLPAVSVNPQGAQWWESVPHVEFHTTHGRIPVSEVMRAQRNYQQCKDQVWPVISQIAPIVNIDPEKILAVCAQESRFELSAVSGKGAQGLMQVMPPTMDGIMKHLRVGKTQNAWPEEKYCAQVRERAKSQGLDINSLINTITSLGKNIAVGTIYLSYLIKTFWEEGWLRRYNSGPTTNRSRENRAYAGWVRAWEKIITATNKPDSLAS